MITKAIILAGGQGVRLAPLTDTLPKPLLPVNNLPTLSHVLRSLEKVGIRCVTVTVGYRKEAILSHYGSIFRTLRLDYSIEETPLGTAGGAKYAAYPAGLATDAYGDTLITDGDILILSGDALFEGDLSALIHTHESTRADVTIAAKQMDDVTGYGVITGSASQIDGFYEKPDPQNTPSHLVNIGVYLLSSRVLAEIPDGTYDFGKELFPSLLRKGYRLAYHVYDDYWCDIGTPKSYLEANLRHSQGESLNGRRCKLPKSSLIEESLLLDDVTVGEHCSIVQSILASHVTVDDGVTLAGCVVGEGCHITETPPQDSAIALKNGTLSVTPLATPLGHSQPIGR